MRRPNICSSDASTLTVSTGWHVYFDGVVAVNVETPLCHDGNCRHCDRPVVRRRVLGSKQPCVLITNLRLISNLSLLSFAAGYCRRHNARLAHIPTRRLVPAPGSQAQPQDPTRSFAMLRHILMTSPPRPCCSRPDDTAVVHSSNSSSCLVS